MSPGPWTDQAPLSRWLAPTEEKGLLSHQQEPGCFLFAESVAFRNHYNAVILGRKKEPPTFQPRKAKQKECVYVCIHR